MKNVRIKLGLSQRALAEMAGTSQQQIQRIETGKVAARLEMATKLADALKTPLGVLFPGTGQPLRKVAVAYQELQDPPDQEVKALLDAGIEVDIRAWYFQVRLRGHRKSLVFHVPPNEKRWLFRKVQDEDTTGSRMTFVIFDTFHERIAINARELVYCHFLFEAAAFVSEDEEAESSAIEVFLVGNPRPLTFGVEPDAGSPDDDEDEGQFRGIFFDLDTYTEDAERIYFEDEDGEDVFLRAGDIALLKAPLYIVDPDYDSDEEFDDLLTSAETNPSSA